MPDMKTLIRQEIFRILELMEETEHDHETLWTWITFFTMKLERCA